MKMLWRITILMTALCGVCASGARAQGWKKYRASWYEVSLPADWPCRHDEKARRLVATSPDGEIFFSARSEPKAAGQKAAGDSSLLKQRLLREYELLNATDGTAFDVTTKNVAVETVNGLRGVVVELTAVVPAERQGGGLVLKKFSGFAFVAEGGAAHYFATVLCPVARFTYHSALMNRIINDLRALDAPGPSTARGAAPAAGSSPRGANSLEGVWLLTHPGGKYSFELRVSGDSGTLRARWNDECGKAVVVEQRVTLEAKHYGLLVKGTAPAYLGREGPQPAYAPSTLLFQRQTDDSWKVWTRNNIHAKGWDSLRISPHVFQAWAEAPRR